MQEYQQRVIDEKKELGEKIHKLGVFITSAICIALPNDERLLLSLQYKYMMLYQSVLAERIEAF